jgi:hypothetical protein
MIDMISFDEFPENVLLFLEDIFMNKFDLFLSFICAVWVSFKINEKDQKVLNVGKLFI